jgi:hypothetical protein
MMVLMESDWALSQLFGMTDSMHLEFEEISWYSIKIRKLGQDKPTYDTKFNLVYEITGI